MKRRSYIAPLFAANIILIIAVAMLFLQNRSYKSMNRELIIQNDSILSVNLKLIHNKPLAQEKPLDPKKKAKGSRRS